MPGDGLSTTRRLFIAVMLPDDVQERLARQARLLDAHARLLRPVKAQAMHITLHFLGETSGERSRQVAEGCAAAVRERAPFDLVVGGFGVFPHAQRPRVVWLGLREGAAALAALQRRVDDELIRRGAIDRRERFTAHITLARVRPDTTPAGAAALGAAVAALPQVTVSRCTADAVSLVQSTLSPGGSIYTVLERWPLAAATPGPGREAGSGAATP